MNLLFTERKINCRTSNVWIKLDPTLSKHIELAEHFQKVSKLPKTPRGKTLPVYIDLGPPILAGAKMGGI